MIARDKDVVLTEYTSYSGNFLQIARQLLVKIKNTTRQSYENNE
jgi:hypothetical protein